MKFKLMVFILSFALMLGCTYKTDNNLTNENTNQGEDYTVEMLLGEQSTYTLPDIQKDGKISLEIDKNEYRNDEFIQYIIKNNSDMVIEFGSDVQLEVYIEQKWLKVNFTNFGYDSELHRTKPNSEFNGKHTVMFLKPGIYRLIHGVSTDGDIREREVYLISDSFNVSQD